MKAKIIKLVLSNKFDAFVKSITDQALQDRVKQGTIITGGCITSMLLREPVNDYDMYFRTRELAHDVAKYFVKKFLADPPASFKGYKIQVEDMYLTGSHKDENGNINSGPNRIRIKIQSIGVAGDIPQEGDDEQEAYQTAVEDADEVTPEKGDKETEVKYRPIFLSSNAITLTNKVQIVIRFFGEPDQIHHNYDFVHCTNYWTSWNRELVLRKDALEATLARELRYVGSLYPICSIIRSRKFIQRGWHINAGQYVKMAWQISKLDLTNIHVLEEQLMGVDAAYFRMLIEYLKLNNANVVDGGYLLTLIDKVF